MKSIHFPLSTTAPMPTIPGKDGKPDEKYYTKARDGWWVYVGKMPSVELELYYMALVALAPKGET